MAAVQTASITIPQHDDYRLYFQVVDENGAAVDISQSNEIVFEVANSVIEPTEIYQKTLGAAQINFQNNSTIYIDLTDTETGLTTGSYYFELRLTNSGGKNSTVLKGTLTIEDTRIGD